MIRGEFAARWPEWLAPLGLGTIERLCNEPFPPQDSDAWKALTKPGLRARERWRLELNNDQAGADTVYIKRYKRSTWREQSDRIFRQAPLRSRGWWEFHLSQNLLAKYVAAPQAVGYAERMLSILERESAVILGAVPGDGTDRVWQKLLADNSPLTRGLARKEFIQRLTRFVSAFHQTGFCHRDLYLCHIFVQFSDAGLPEFHLIDLARAFRPRIRRTRWVLKDLSQLDYSARQVGASRVDRMRGLVAYLGLEPGSARVRWYARAIAKRSDAILRREIRKGRA